MKRATKIVLSAVSDIVATGLCLCVFAYYHHVKPVVYSADMSLPKAPAASDSIADETTADAATETAVPADDFDFGAKFANKFTDGEIIATDTTYQSANISATVTKVAENGVTYYVLDFYIKNLDNLRTAFAQDTYGKGITETIPQMAADNSAIAAVNGDYYGTHQNRGVIIRNGYLYRADEAYGDVCVIYNDGTMSGMYKNDYNKEHAAFVENVWQGWCFGPILVENGSARLGVSGDVAGKNPRTGIGYFEPGHYCLITVDGRQDGYSTGMTYDEFAECFAALGCEFAYNLDGGQSSMMVFDGSMVNQSYKGGREVSDIIYLGE